MTIRKKLRIPITLLASLLLFTYVTQKRINEEIPHYIKNNLAEIMESQEKILGIKHFGIPKISHKRDPNDRNSPRDLGIGGAYKKDKIYLPLEYKPNSKGSLTNILFTAINFVNISQVKKTLDHELGHYYADKLSKSLGMGNWPKYHNSERGIVLKQDLGIKIVSEGIAEYFERKVNNTESIFDFNFDFKDSDWPEKLKDFSSYHIYNGGYNLVKPIIDKQGKIGIEYLIVNPPNKYELKDIPKYRKKALTSLSRTN